MPDMITLPPREFRLGDKKKIGLKNLRAFDGSAITATATVTISDASLTATSMTMSGSGTRKMGASYLLTTGSAQTITSAGTYRAVYTVTNGSEVQTWQQDIVVKTSPT